MIGVAIVDCTTSAMLTPAQPERTSSSPHTVVYHQSPPEPPTSSGYEAPRKPISPAFLKISRGKSSAFSHSATWGASSFCTQSRSVLRKISCSSRKKVVSMLNISHTN